MIFTTSFGREKRFSSKKPYKVIRRIGNFFYKPLISREKYLAFRKSLLTKPVPDSLRNSLRGQYDAIPPTKISMKRYPI